MNALVPLKGFALRTMVIHIAEKAGLAFTRGVDKFTTDNRRLSQLVKGISNRRIAIETDGNIAFSQLSVDMAAPTFFARRAYPESPFV